MKVDCYLRQAVRGRGRILVRRRLWPGRRDGARAHSRRSGNGIKHLESLEIGSLINCADEAIDAAAETFSSGRISALKEMKTLGKLMIEQDMRALGA